MVSLAFVGYGRYLFRSYCSLNALSLWRCKVELSSEPSIWSDVRATFRKGLKLETSCWSSSPQRKWKQTSCQSRCLVLCWTRWRIDCVFMISRSWNVRLQMVSQTSRHDADRVSEISVCPWSEEGYARRRKCSVWRYSFRCIPITFPTYAVYVSLTLLFLITLDKIHK